MEIKISSKKKLEEIGFLFVTLPTRLIKMSLNIGVRSPTYIYGNKRITILKASAMSEKTLIKIANKWFNNLKNNKNENN